MSTVINNARVVLSNISYDSDTDCAMPKVSNQEPSLRSDKSTIDLQSMVGPDRQARSDRPTWIVRPAGQIDRPGQTYRRISWTMDKRM